MKGEKKVKNSEIIEKMGGKTHTLSEFNSLLGNRMNPTAKANYLKGLALAGIVTVDLSVDHETGDFVSKITAKNASDSESVTG